jgi:hypothetical protein
LPSSSISDGHQQRADDGRVDQHRQRRADAVLLDEDDLRGGEGADRDREEQRGRGDDAPGRSRPMRTASESEAPGRAPP